MESFNKNWLAILLIAVVFFLLGFLVSKTMSKSCKKRCGRKAKSCHVEKGRKHNGKRAHALFKEGCGNVEVDVQVEVDSAKNEKTITKTIKKTINK